MVLTEASHVLLPNRPRSLQSISFLNNSLIFIILLFCQSTRRQNIDCSSQTSDHCFFQSHHFPNHSANCLITRLNIKQQAASNPISGHSLSPVPGLSALPFGLNVADHSDPSDQPGRQCVTSSHCSHTVANQAETEGLASGIFPLFSPVTNYPGGTHWSTHDQ